MGVVKGLINGVADPRLGMIRERVPPGRGRGDQEHRHRPQCAHGYWGWVGPSTPWNGVHVKIFGAMSSR